MSYNDVLSTVFDDLRFLIESEIITDTTKGYLLSLLCTLGVTEV